MKKLLLIAYLAITTLSLSAEVKVLAFAGSTRKESYNKQLVNDAAEIARKIGAKVTVIDLNDYPIPFFDEDVEKKGVPKYAKLLRQLMIENDAMIISSPEYNGSISAVLKNAIDWVSRGENGNPSRAAFKGKKFAIMSASPGQGGGGRGLIHLRSILENAGGTVISKQVTIPDAAKYFSEKSRPENSALKEEVEQLLSDIEAIK